MSCIQIRLAPFRAGYQAPARRGAGAGASEPNPGAEVCLAEACEVSIGKILGRLLTPRHLGALGRKPRDIYIPDLRIEGAINVKTRDFR